MIKIGFTGTQEGMSDYQIHKFRFFLELYEPGEFHHGDCIGADKQANDIARSLGWRIVSHPPASSSKRAWCIADEYHAPKWYLDRNHDIVDAVAYIIAAPLTDAEVLRSGTWATIRYAKKQGKLGAILKRSFT